MTEAGVKRSLDQVSRESLSQLEDLAGTAGSALQRMRGCTRSAGDFVSTFETKVESLFASATKLRFEMLAKLIRAKAVEARTKAAFERRRRWLLLLITYYQYRWKVLRFAAITGVLFLVYDNWGTIMLWGEAIGQAIQELLAELEQQAPSSQKSAPTSGGTGR
jgi:hypothetical protein